MMSAGKRFAKRLKARLFAPYKIRHIGESSRIHRPRTIDGAEFISLGSGSMIRAHAWLCAIKEHAGRQYTPSIEIGDNVYIGHYVCITCIDSVCIESDCVLSEGVYLADSAHGYDPDKGPIMQQALTSKGPVRVGRGSFLGFRSIIMPGVSLGKHCVVGAHTVVTRSFPDYSMVVGSPARIVKRFAPDSGRWLPVEG
jgi:acetyltransferase-like isoleucine patch superfamily enzyme